MFQSAWITHPDAGYSENRIWLFQKTFTLCEKPERATLNISAEAGYCWGFMNSFTEAEQNATGNVLNQYYDSRPAAGKRLARGLEISISIGMPFGKREKQNTIKEETKCEEEQK